VFLVFLSTAETPEEAVLSSLFFDVRITEIIIQERKEQVLITSEETNIFT